MNDSGADRNPSRAFPVFIPVGGEHKNVSPHLEYMETCLPLIHNSGISVNPCGNAAGRVFAPVYSQEVLVGRC